MSYPAVKVCGICRLEDACKAVELGAEYLGFIFAESPRSISPQEARSIKKKLQGQAKFVGVFKDQDLRQVNDTAQALGLDFVQLHGKETAEYCRKLSTAVIKAVEIGAQMDFEIPEGLAVHAILFDRPKALSADTGWLENLAAKLSNELQKYQPFFIAGGLDSRNLESALKLNPYGLDLASSLESEPGVKDHKKMELFFSKLKGAQERC